MFSSFAIHHNLIFKTLKKIRKRRNRNWGWVNSRIRAHLSESEYSNMYFRTFWRRFQIPWEDKNIIESESRIIQKEQVRLIWGYPDGFLTKGFLVNFKSNRYLENLKTPCAIDCTCSKCWRSEEVLVLRVEL